MRRTPTGFKTFQPIQWHGFYGPTHYTSHLQKEMGRLGMDIWDIGFQGDKDSVLADVLSWIDDWGNESLLYDWQNLNVEVLVKRIEHRGSRVKPRIRVSPYITARDNLSVVWYPVGWREHFWSAEEREKGCDFAYFRDEGPMFERPHNELMFIHGVGNLRPGKTEDYGSYLRYNKAVVDEILLCAVRSAYESLIARLRENFEITERQVFVFEEKDGRVVEWSLQDPKEIQRRQDEAEFSAIEKNYGFTIEIFDEALRIALTPSARAGRYYLLDSAVNQRLAKNLTKAGHKVTPTQIDRLRALIARCRPEPPSAENLVTADC